MSDASDKLARSRQAIVAHLARRERRHDPREEPAREDIGYEAGDYASQDREPPGAGWFGHMRYAVGTWWRHHPAHMAVELVSPVMRNYARRKPVQLLAISVGVGAALTLARPWKVLSVTTLLIALLKSSHLPGLLMAAMSASDYRKDNDRPD
ncbi:MAG: hypothetical protein JWP65_3829 [Ramlibacter sp.]|uniref:hypothetical protein n=1 Tax=Ramlibacter sp. TaxID=1917967 RepID=UPI00263259B8|nr:hypothetical protein [Ramlibacter sp.]MDB5753408.1 hypothetical protein [Ramlibacter sp.]